MIHLSGTFHNTDKTCSNVLPSSCNILNAGTYPPGSNLHHIGQDGIFILRAFRCSEGVRVEVEDHGPGIAAADLPYIFDRYYRSRSDAGKQGTGLGLSITKAIFQQHSFRFGVQSTVGKGTTFWFVMSDLPYVDDFEGK